MNVQNIGGTPGRHEKQMRIGSSITVDGKSQVLGPGEYGSILFEYTFTSTGTFTFGFGILAGLVLVSEPEPDPEPKTPSGIPGFPVESLVLSIILASVFLWMIRKNN